MKRCLNCGTEIILEPTTNNYLKSNFRLRKFCDDRCRIEYNNKSKKKQYFSIDTEHNNKVKELNSFINGSICVLHNRKGGCNPDIIKENSDYELKVFRKINHLKEKARKWDRSRKHILVVSISEQTKSLFDEVYILTQKNLIKEK